MRLRFKSSGKTKLLDLHRSPMLLGRDVRADIAFKRKELELKNSLLVRFEKQWVLYDLRTERKIICNDLVVGRCFLAPGQRLRFGGIVVDVEADDREAPSDSGDTSVNMGLTQTSGAKLVFSGAWQGEIDCSDDCLIGSGPMCDVRLPHEAGISNRHAFVAWYGNDAHLFDLKSTNGIVALDQKVAHVKLADVGKVKLGQLKMKFVRSNGASSASSGSSSGAGSDSNAKTKSSSDSQKSSGFKPVTFAPFQPPPPTPPAQQAYEEALRERHQGREKKAVEYLYRALELDPFETKFRDKLREWRRAKFDNKAERVGWRTKLAARAHALRVKAVRHAGDNAAALVLAENLVAKNPWNGRVMYEQALAFAALERDRRKPPFATLWALMCVRETHDDRMSDPVLNATIGDLLVDMGAFARVKAILQPALRKFPNDRRLAEVLNRAGVDAAMLQN